MSCGFSSGLWGIVVSAEVVEEMAFGEAIGPAFLGDLAGEIVLRRPGRHGQQFGSGRFASRCVFGIVQDGQLMQQIWAFEHDAAAGVRGGQLTKISEELGIVESVCQRAVVVDRFSGKLHNRTGFDIAPG